MSKTALAVNATFTKNSNFFYLYFAHDPQSLDSHLFTRAVLRTRRHVTQSSNHFCALNDVAKHRMLSIQPRCWNQRDEELATIRIRSCVCHGQDSRARVPERWMEFVFE